MNKREFWAWLRYVRMEQPYYFHQQEERLYWKSCKFKIFFLVSCFVGLVGSCCFCSDVYQLYYQSASTNASSLPSPIPLGIPVFFLVLIVLTLVIFAFLRFLFMREIPVKYGSAHFASLAEMRVAGFTQEGGVPLGIYYHKRIWLSEARQDSHVLLVAPTGKGKTSGIIIPGLLRENGNRSLVINDVKGELLSKCAGTLAQHSTIKIFAPTKPHQSHYYNPLAHVSSMEDAEDIADAWIYNTGVSKSDPFWDRAASTLITAVILHLTQGASTLAPFGAIADILTGMTLDDMVQLLLNSPSTLARRSMITFVNSITNNPKLGGSILLEVASRFRILNNPTIRDMTADDEFDFHALVDHPSTWFLSIPASEAQRLKPLAAIFYMQMMKTLTRRAENSPNGRLPRSIAFYLDEFCNAGRIPHFEQHISLVRSAGIAFLLAVQDFGQLHREYGQDIAETILANTTTHIVFPGCGQQECEYYSRRMGTTTFVGQSVGITEGPPVISGAGGTSRRLMNADEIRTMQQGKLLILHSNLPPLRIENSPYYQRPELLARVNLPFAYPSHNKPRITKPLVMLPPQSQQTPPPGTTSQQSTPPPGATNQQTPPGTASQSAPDDPFMLP